MKTCTKCGQEKDIESFAPRKGRNTRNSRCRDCTREYLVQWRRDNPQKQAQYAEYKKQNPRPYDPEYAAEYYQRNKERLAELARLRKEADPDKYHEMKRERSRVARERRIQRTDEEIASDFLRLRPQGKKCRLCGVLKSADSFNIARHQADGRFAHCRECDSEYSLEKRQRRLRKYWIKQGLDPDRCVYCLAKGEVEVEHFYPVSSGAAEKPRNIFPACRECNRGPGGKFAKDPWVWLGERFPERVLFFRDWWGVSS